MFERYSYPSRQAIFLSRVIAAHVQAKAIEASHLPVALIIGDQGIRIAERLGAASFDLTYLSGSSVLCGRLFSLESWPMLSSTVWACASPCPISRPARAYPSRKRSRQFSVLQQSCRAPA